MCVCSQLIVNALDKITHAPRDLPLEIVIAVDDENDNKPEFQGRLAFTVPEQSLSKDQQMSDGHGV